MGITCNHQKKYEANDLRVKQSLKMEVWNDNENNVIDDLDDVDKVFQPSSAGKYLIIPHFFVEIKENKNKQLKEQDDGALITQLEEAVSLQSQVNNLEDSQSKSQVKVNKLKPILKQGQRLSLEQRCQLNMTAQSKKRNNNTKSPLKNSIINSGKQSPIIQQQKITTQYQIKKSNFES